MYELYKVGDDTYQIHSSFKGEKAMEGTQLAIMTYMINTLKFNSDQVLVAMMDILEGTNDSAHFGMNRIWIYGFKKIRKYGNKVA